MKNTKRQPGTGILDASLRNALRPALPTGTFTSSRIFRRISFMIAVALLVLFPYGAFAAPQSRTLPCAVDSHGNEVIFNKANPGLTYRCSITITTNADGSEDVKINQPVVDNPGGFFEYKAIIFSPGDAVTITADGCVQTAGHGATWKRYVNPSGEHSGPPDGLYFGTVKIPSASWGIKGGNGHVQPEGALPEGIEIKKLTPQPGGTPEIFIPGLDSFPGHEIDLTLGYKDDDYTGFGGNGYWKHDNGNNDQCANTSANAPRGSFGGPAWVKLHVVHDQANPFGSVVPRQWDLVPNGFDPNGLFLNPEWGWQVLRQPIAKQGSWDPSCLPGCSSQNPSFDNSTITATNWPSHIIADVCNMGAMIPGPLPAHFGTGHHNWFEVAYHGVILWTEKSPEPFGDDDYNLRLRTQTFHADPAGTTAGNISSDNVNLAKDITLEFDSDETIDHFDQNPYWKSFHSDVDNFGGSPFDAAEAIVIGLMGFDEMHAPYYTEIHPVHVLVAREKHGPTAADPANYVALDPSHDRWFYFVRNWGNEGECSHLQHYLMASQITVKIPPPTITDFKGGFLKFGTSVLNQNPPVLGVGADGTLQFYSGREGTFVTFNLQEGATQPYAFGEFELSWNQAVPGEIIVDSGQLFADKIPELRTGFKTSGAGQHTADKPIDPEEHLANMWKKTTPAQQQTFKTLLNSLSPAKPRRVNSPIRVEIMTRPPQRPKHAPRVSNAPATEKLQRDAARMQAWCAATRGHLPDHPTWCLDAKVPPVTVLTTTGGAVSTNAREPVKAALTAYDASGAGIGATEYSFDGQTWQNYTGPFTVAEGRTVHYRSKDKKGTQEEVKHYQQRSLASETSTTPSQ